MEAGTFGTCKMCNRLMNEPRILPCRHSFCLRCLESLSIDKNSSKCPECRLDFLIPKGGMKNLKINEFIEKVKNMMQCNICHKNEAVIRCLDCLRNYCSSCLEPHKNIPATSKHRIESLRETSAIGKIKDDFSTCQNHSEYMTLYCEECRVLICGYCMTSDHIGHKIGHVSKQCDIMKNDLVKNIKIAEKTLEKIIFNFKNTQKISDENRKKESEIRKQILDRGEHAKSKVDLLIKEAIKTLDDEFKIVQDDVENTMRELTNMEEELNVSITALKQKLQDLNHGNFGKSFHPVVEFDSMPECSNNFKVSFLFPKDIQIANFGVFQKDFDSFDTNSAWPSMMNMCKTLFQTLFVGNKTEHHRDHHLFYINRDSLVFSGGNATLKVYERDSLKLKSKHDMKDKLSHINDVLLVEDMLYILGQQFERFCIVFQVDLASDLSGHIYHHVYEDINKGLALKMSASPSKNVLLVFDNKLVHIPLDGSSTKTLNLSFSIKDAVQFSSGDYVVCDGYKLFKINNHGRIDKGSKQYKIGSMDGSRFQMVKDNLGHLYVAYNNECIMLDGELNFLKHIDFYEDVKYLCYDEFKNRLITFMRKNQSYCFRILLLT